MKIPYSIIIIVIISLTSVLLLLSGLSLLNNELKDFENKEGMVLGVSAEIIDNDYEKAFFSNNTFPQSNYIYFLPPRKQSNEEIELNAYSGSVLDCGSGSVIFEKEAEKEVAIASITKLMTALIFLDTNPDFESEYIVSPQDRVEGGKIYLFNGDRVKIRDLFYLSLVGSANTATRALVNSTGMSQEEYVKAMNIKADSLGLKNTKFVDPIGISAYNVSTAKEVAKLAKTALENKYINEATLTDKYEFTTLTGKKKIVYSTDDLLTNFPQNGIKIMGGKTGYIEAANYCFVGKFTDVNNNEIITVILGSPDKYSRFTETRRLAEWIYTAYKWHK